jgi:hypothetical protein
MSRGRRRVSIEVLKTHGGKKMCVPTWPQSEERPIMRSKQNVVTRNGGLLAGFIRLAVMCEEVGQAYAQISRRGACRARSHSAS